MPQNTVTLTLDESQQERLFRAFCDTAAKAPQYAKWQLRPENCVITCYQSGKCVFQGSDAEVYASAFRNDAPVPSLYPQAGSDEVGTGDYFGPVCVAACIVREEDLPLLQKLQVRDSKMITDDTIRRTAPELAAVLPHSLLIVPDAKYNEVHASRNMNAIKAILHNSAYLRLSSRCPLPALKVVDQFTPEKNYYRYLAGEREIVRGIRFETKAENKYEAVACASIIARYAFLVSMDRMSEQYGMTFPKGASAEVDAKAREFTARYGKEKLGEVAKLHFKNTERI